MSRIDSSEMTKTHTWREFRDWAKENALLAASEVSTAIEKEHYDYEYRKGRRTEAEAVWGMVLAFEKEGRSAVESREVEG